MTTIGPTEPVATRQDNPTLLTQPHEIAVAVAAAYDAGAARSPIYTFAIRTAFLTRTSMSRATPWI